MSNMMLSELAQEIRFKPGERQKWSKRRQEGPREHSFGTSVTELPIYNSTYIIGAGPSATKERIWNDIDKYDAVLITLPMARALAEFLPRDNVYLVDAETEGWIVKMFYGEFIKDIQLICPTKKSGLGPGFKSIHTFPYSRVARLAYLAQQGLDKMEWPISSGAVALKVALDVFKSKKIGTVGIDLSGYHSCFEHETRPYLERLRGLPN